MEQLVWLTWEILRHAIRESMQSYPKQSDRSRVAEKGESRHAGFGIIADSDGVFLDFHCVGEVNGTGSESLGSRVWKAGLRQILEGLGNLLTRPLDQVLEEVFTLRKKEGAGPWPLIAERMAQWLRSNFDGASTTGEEIFKAIADNARQVISDMPPELVRHYDLVPKFLAECHGFDIPVIVVTSASCESIEAEYARWGVRGHVTGILAAEQTKAAKIRYKPHPDLFRFARENPKDADYPGLGFQEEQVTLILEDNLTNLARGVDAVPYSYGIGFARAGRNVPETKELLLEKIAAAGLSKKLTKRILIIDPAKGGFKHLLDLILSLDFRKQEPYRRYEPQN